MKSKEPPPSFKPLIKPPRLHRGDKVAVVSLSWGGPESFPHRYSAGKKQLTEAFGFDVVEMPHALKSAEWLAQNPKARADDLMQALRDPDIKGIVSSIGGDDSIRLLPYIDLGVIRDNPKVFVGYSDTTVTHFAFYKTGVVSFYGPSIMAGFGENGGIPRYLQDSFASAVMNGSSYELLPNEKGWMFERTDWGSPDCQPKPRSLEHPLPWQWLQGEGFASGPLIGGCLEVVDWLRGSTVWPSRDEWRGKVIFLEVSEEGMSESTLEWTLRAFAATGVFESCAGVLFGRPGGQRSGDFRKHDDIILKVLRDQYGLKKLPIITQMDFGHTDPMMTIPLGVTCAIDCDKKTIVVSEAACS